MATLSLNETDVSAIKKTLTYHEDHSSGDQLKLEVGENELDTAVTEGKSWNVQVSIVVTETSV